MFPDQHVSGDYVVRSDDFARPRAGARTSIDRAVALQVENGNLAQVEEFVIFAELFHHLRWRIAELHEPLRQLQLTIVAMRLNGHQTAAQHHVGAASTDRRRAGGLAEARFL